MSLAARNLVIFCLAKLLYGPQENAGISPLNVSPASKDEPKPILQPVFINEPMPVLT